MIKIKMYDVNAVVPTKAGSEEVGFDLTAISFIKKLNEFTFMYDTGIAVEPPPGYYVEIVPRSSIGKTGFVLANSVGIIDPSYRGTLKIVLMDVGSTARLLQNQRHHVQYIGRPLTCPFTLTQLVLRKMIPAKIEVVEELTDTIRGDGAFGSTGLNGGNSVNKNMQ